MPKLNTKKLIILVLALIVGIGVGVLIKNYIPSGASLDESEQAVVGNTFGLLITYSDGSADFYEEVEFSKGDTLFTATQEFLESEGTLFEFEDYGDLGMLVTNIGEQDTEGENGYWQYWVNGEYAQVGASVYEIQSGDSIEWRFTDAQE